MSETTPDPKEVVAGLQKDAPPTPRKMWKTPKVILADASLTAAQCLANSDGTFATS
jgi:hypothetical protein